MPPDIGVIIQERLDEMVDALDSFGRLEELVRTAGRGAYAHAEFMIDEMGTFADADLVESTMLNPRPGKPGPWFFSVRIPLVPAETVATIERRLGDRRQAILVAADLFIGGEERIVKQAVRNYVTTLDEMGLATGQDRKLAA